MALSRLTRKRPVTTVPLLGRGWVLPYWLERQADPASPAYVVGGADPTNITGRNWTLLGGIGSVNVGGVDPRGLVVSRAGSWSLDWWIRSEQRWHFPSRETAVRQRSLDDTPVVITAMHVPGGDIEHRAYSAGGEDDAIVIEIENTTPVPVAVTLALRPYGLIGQARVGEIRFEPAGNGADNVVSVDGEPALIVPRQPGQIIGSNLAGGDCAALVDLDDPPPFDGVVSCGAGLAQLALSFPLVHTGVLRVELPFPTRRRGGWQRTRSPRRADRRPLPSAEQVANGWHAHTDRGARFVLPEGQISSVFERARRSLLLFARGQDVLAEPLSRPGLNWRDAAPILGSLDRMGWHAEVGDVVSSLPRRQEASGEIAGRRGEIDGTSAALAVAGHHLRLSGVDDLADMLAPSVARAAQFIERQRTAKGDRDELTKGLLPARDLGGHLEFRYADNFWALRGLSSAAAILRAAGETEAAADVAAFAADLRVDLLASLEGIAARFGDDALPATPHRSVDERAIDALVAVWPTGVLRADHPMMLRTAEVLREHHLHDGAHHNTIGPRGLGTYRTARLAMAELMAGDARALERIDWLTSVASPTGAWPRAVHPALGTGTVGEGHHGVTTAHFVSLVRALLVQEMVGDEPALSLLSVLPRDWIGQGIEVHDAPTSHGRLSYAIRWHGERPAILWELDQPTDSAPVLLRVPGLDPSWSSREAKGEALLEAPRVADDRRVTVTTDRGDDTGPAENPADIDLTDPPSFS